MLLLTRSVFKGFDLLWWMFDILDNMVLQIDFQILNFVILSQSWQTPYENGEFLCFK